VRLEELERLIRQGETVEVEFEASLPAPQDIARHVAAFSNTNGGILILGVQEPAEIVGVDERRARGSIEMARQYLSPVPEMKVQALQVRAHTVVLVEVAASEELHAAMGGYFGRGARPAEVFEMHRADATRPLTPAEIRLHALKGKSEDAALSRLATAIADETRIIEKQAETIDRLGRDLAKANAPWIKIALALAGVIAGAVLMYLVSAK
jgi:predicted HTH transcriptional regulator